MADLDVPGLPAAAERLEAVADELVAEQMRVLATFPAYARVPDDDKQRACRRNVLRAVTVLRGGGGLPDGVEDEATCGRRRAAQGLSAEIVVTAYRAVMVVVLDAFLREAARVDATQPALLASVRRLWELTDHHSVEMFSACHEVVLDLARREERDRQDFLHNLLTGRLADTDVVEAGGAEFGLGSTSEVYVLRARSCSEVPTLDLQRVIERASRTAVMQPLLGLIGGDLVGIVRRAPETVDDSALVAIEGPVLPDAVSAAFLRVSKLLDLGVRFDLRGVLTADRLSLRAAVAQDEALGRRLHQRYVAALDPRAAITGLILESVETYLDCQRSIPAAAQALNVHVNTLRYRLERYEAVTGCELSDTLALFEVWWALQFAKIRSDSSESGGPGGSRGSSARRAARR